VHKFSIIDVKRALISFIGDSIPHFLPKHALAAPHVIRHNVLELRLEGVFVNDVEVNKVIGCNLDAGVSFDIVNEGSNLNRVILDPVFCF